MGGTLEVPRQQYRRLSYPYLLFVPDNVCVWGGEGVAPGESTAAVESASVCVLPFSLTNSKIGFVYSKNHPPERLIVCRKNLTPRNARDVIPSISPWPIKGNILPKSVQTGPQMQQFPMSSEIWISAA